MREMKQLREKLRKKKRKLSDYEKESEFERVLYFKQSMTVHS